jgi:predicted phosphohydrolase
MDKFGPEWVDHANKIKDNWPLEESDIIIMPGDFSWALKIDELIPDLEWLDALPGKKILSRGNHDMWWTSHKKLDDLASQFKTISFLHNESVLIDGISICVAKGYNVDLDTDEARKLINRESIRLDISLSKAESDRKIVFMHYPPISISHGESIFSEILEKHSVEKCYYGHLHGKAQISKVLGDVRGVDYQLISSDYIGFIPVKV